MYKELTQEKKLNLIQIMSEELPALRAKAGLSQDEIANIIGISRQSFNLIELNKIKMTWGTCTALMMYFSLNPNTSNLMKALGLIPEKNKRATSSEGYDELTGENNRLREKREEIQLALAEDKGRQQKREELVDFLHERATEFEELDDGLVRRLIEQITVHENGTFTVEFKSGTMVEI